jgi:hypothetical protein
VQSQLIWLANSTGRVSHAAAFLPKNVFGAWFRFYVEQKGLGAILRQEKAAARARGVDREKRKKRVIDPTNLGAH